MNLAYYISALTLGFLGSFHCMGMCGPLALMLPKNDGSKFKIIVGRCIYNSGRIVTYISLGILFGVLGLAIAMKGLQKEFSILTGLIILLSILFTLIFKKRILPLNGTGFFTTSIRKKLKYLFAIKSKKSLFFIGVLNGLLPCGFVYMAIAGAASSGSFYGSMAYMALFGLGTFPMMMTITIFADLFGIKFKKSFKKISIAVAISLGLFLIFRGVNMAADDCCHKKIIHATSFCPVI